MMRGSRRSTRRTRTHDLRPRGEALESRLLLYSTIGGQWAYGDRITYSFAPDGTSVGGIPSAWYQAMSSRGFGEQVWKDEFRKAAATWQGVTGINFVEVPDDGSALSVSGNQQNDARFGDIRIAGINLGGITLAAAYLPPPYNGGTLAGDIMMNTQAAWNVNSAYDLRTVAIHEIGHALGMGHSMISTAVMYDFYNGTKQALTSDDIAGIRSIYGMRPQDAFDASASNQQYYNATNVTGYLDDALQIRLAYLDITATSDFDWYYVTAPATSGYWMTAAVQSEYLSSLSPTVEVYDNSLKLVGSASAANSYGATVVTHIPAVVPGQRYYIRVRSANSGPSSNGSYALLANFGTAPLYLVPPPDTTVPEQPNQGSGSMLLSALRSQLDAALASLVPGHRKQIERAISRLADGSGHLDATMVRSDDLQKILARLNPAQRRAIEAALESMEHVVQIGDLAGYASVLTTADLRAVVESPETGPRPGRPAGRPSGMPASVYDLVIALTGEEMEPVLTSSVIRDRDRAGASAIDRILAEWEPD